MPLCISIGCEYNSMLQLIQSDEYIAPSCNHLFVIV